VAVVTARWGPLRDKVAAEPGEAMNELRLPWPRLRADARLWSLAEQARRRSTRSGNCEQHWRVVAGRWAVELIWNRRTISRRAPAREDLNDDHPAAAARTRMREYLRLTVAGAVSITGRILWRRYVEQLTRSGDVLGAAAVGEETIVTDAVETVGQDVDQEAADELVGVERLEFVARDLMENLQSAWAYGKHTVERERSPIRPEIEHCKVRATPACDAYKSARILAP
jgi:hypothetical protein